MDFLPSDGEIWFLLSGMFVIVASRTKETNKAINNIKTVEKITTNQKCEKEIKERLTENAR